MKEIFGLMGVLLVQGSTLFQIIRFIKTKKTDGVSVAFWWTIFLGLCCYLVYSISIGDVIYTISNSIGITLTAISLALYYKYRGCNRGQETTKV